MKHGSPVETKSASDQSPGIPVKPKQEQVACEGDASTTRQDEKLNLDVGRDLPDEIPDSEDEEAVEEFHQRISKYYNKEA